MKFTLPLAALTLLALAACGADRSGTVTTEDGEEVDYTVSGDGGQFTVTSGDGTAEMRIGPDVKVELPNGFTVYPGAEVVSNATMANIDGQDGAMVVMNTADAPEKVVAFYRKQMEAAGIGEFTTMNSSQMATIGGEVEGGITASLMASKTGEGTSATLTVASR